MPIAVQTMPKTALKQFHVLEFCKDNGNSIAVQTMPKTALKLAYSHDVTVLRFVLQYRPCRKRH